MYTKVQRIALLALPLILAVSFGACKKKDAEKKESKDDMAPAMEPMKRAMEPMKRAMDAMDAMTAPRKDPPARPKKLSFEEQIKKSTPTTPKPTEQKAGKLTLKAEHCKVEGVTFLNPSNMSVLKDVVATDKQVYVLTGKGEVYRFDVAAGKDCKLTLDKKWGKDGMFKASHKVEKLALDKKGTLVLSSFMGITRLDKGGKTLAPCKPGRNRSLALHPSGKWGLSFFVGSTVTMVTLSAKECKGKPWVLQDLSNDKKRKGDLRMAHTIGFYKNLVLVGGVHKDKVKKFNPRVVIAYTKAGKKKFQMGRLEGHGDDGFGWVHGIQQGKKGKICVLDSNYRRLSFWDDKGKFQGAVKLGKLFGVHYPWINSFNVTPKGAGWFVVGSSRKFKEKAPKGTRWSVGEGFLFRVTGL